MMAWEPAESLGRSPIVYQLDLDLQPSIITSRICIVQIGSLLQDQKDKSGAHLSSEKWM
jgi:hypothetical protein